MTTITSNWKDATTMPTESPYDTLVRLRRDYPTPIPNAHLGRLLNDVAWEHRADGFGVLHKPDGANTQQPRTALPISRDILARLDTVDRDGNGTFVTVCRIFDCLIDAEGAARPTWSEKNSLPAGRWRRPVDRNSELPEPPQPPPQPPPPPAGKPYIGDDAFTRLGDVLFADYAAAGQPPNSGMGTWFGRSSWDMCNPPYLTAEQSIAKHRSEWRAALGLPALIVLWACMLLASVSAAELDAIEINQRAGRALARAGYDYASTVVVDEAAGKSKLFTCGSESGKVGDRIFVSTARRFWEPFTKPQVQLRPNPGYLDGLSVCDPSVVLATSGRWAGHWFMYYGATPWLTMDECVGACPGQTFLFVAWSKAGIAPWYRTNGYAPIVYPRGATNPRNYGAGQPSVFFRDADQLFYMLYTDVSGLGLPDPAHVYALRSNSYLFQGSAHGERLEEYRASRNAWVPLTGTDDLRRTTEAFPDAWYSPDWGLSLSSGVPTAAIVDSRHGETHAVVTLRPLGDLRDTSISLPVAYNPAGTWTTGCTGGALDGAGLAKSRNGTLWNEGWSEGRRFVSIDLFTAYWCPTAFDAADFPVNFLKSDIFWRGGDWWVP